MKSRQIGASWLISAYVLWYALGHRGANIILFSKGEEEAKELLGKSMRIYNHLPPYLQLQLGAKSSTMMTFPAMESTIRACAATETAGIGYTTSIVVCDEWEEHPYAEENFMSSKPTRDAGGQFIGIFTVNKQKPDTMAKTVFKNAIEHKSDFTPIFDPYTVRPGRDDKWYEETKRSVPSSELRGLTPELYMEQNYPRSIDEALRLTKTSAAFDYSALDWMMEQTRPPMRLKDTDLDFGVCNIYKPYSIGQSYIAASDVSHGVGKDYSVTVILNCNTAEVVADILRTDIPPEELAYHSVKLLQLYKSPKWFPEDNDWGRAMINRALELGYKNFGYQDEKKTKEGWHTGKGNRFALFGDLIPAINNRQITIYNSSGLMQFYDIIRNIEKEGRIEAAQGRHDDYPMALAIAWHNRTEVSTSSWKPSMVETGITFRRVDKRPTLWLRR